MLLLLYAGQGMGRPFIAPPDLPPGRLDILRRAADSLAIPVIASLNGTTHEGWAGFAPQLEQASARPERPRQWAMKRGSWRPRRGRTWPP